MFCQFCCWKGCAGFGLRTKMAKLHQCDLSLQCWVLTKGKMIRILWIRKLQA
jgi:hypothetical protein